MYRLATLTIGLFLPIFSAFAQEATFEGLGDLPGGGMVSQGYDVSADGSVVVGGSNSKNGNEAFYWTEENGMVGLEELPGGSFESWSYAISADGSVAAGNSSSGNGLEAFRWTEEGGMVGLGDLSGGGFYSYAWSTSADGSMVIGVSESASGLEAFRWEAAADTMVGLEDLPGGNFYSYAYDISLDGSVVVGGSSSSDGIEPFRWEDGEMEGLGNLPGGDFEGHALGVDADGSVVIGESNSAQGSQAFRWEATADTMIGLGDLPGGSFFSSAWATSSDGSIVVGYSSTDNGEEAFYWTEEDGMQSLKDVLESDYGLDLTGWTLRGAYGFAQDGSVIIGWGTNPDGSAEAWRATGLFPVTDETFPEEPEHVLSSPHPNPVKKTSTFTIAVERGQHVAVEVFDTLGRHMQAVYEGTLTAGMSERLTLDASALPAGVYVVRATGENFSETRQVTVLR